MALVGGAVRSLFRGIGGGTGAVVRHTVFVARLGGGCPCGALGVAARHFSSPTTGVSGVAAAEEGPPVVQVDYSSLVKMEPAALAALRQAFVGPKAYGAVAVVNIPTYKEKLRSAFRAGIDLALTDEEGRKRAAAVNNTYPGWSGEPGKETHPLQSSFLYNVKEEINGKPEPYFGKNVYPSPEFHQTFGSLCRPMHEAALQVLRGCDKIMDDVMTQEGLKWSEDGRSLHRLGDEGPVLAGRFICYDSGFTREDSLLREKDVSQHVEEQVEANVNMSKSVGHAGDGLASMRTHSTPVKSAGHAGDGLASMRTHSTPVKSAGHAGDGLASMRTHSTPVKSAGHAGDGLASMRTHSTPVKSAGHAGDGLASMRTHSTPVKSAGHAGDGLASMRTHSTPVKSAGHAGDGLASMRTHSTPVKSAGHAGDGLASMRTHSTPVKSAGHAGDGLASMRTHSTPVKSAGHAGDGVPSMRSQFVPPNTASDGLASARPLSTLAMTGSEPNGHAAFEAAATLRVLEEAEELNTTADSNGLGEYWLPWHIDSNYLTLIHKEMYANESDATFAADPEGAGVLMMNQEGQVTKLVCPEDALIVQMGAFAQIYAGGHMTACRHAVVNPLPPGVARFNYCNFWYVKWDTLCTVPAGREGKAVNKGWNAMMDESYIDITMKQGFAAFRQFMTSPEARLQFQNSVRFKELAELVPLPARHEAARSRDIVVDLLTDIRCPFSYIALLSFKKAVKSQGLHDRVHMRYHPVFLNPNVSKEGECLDDYLFREYGITKEQAHSKDYPLYKAGLEAGVELNPHRRVLNTFDAFCLMELAERQGLQDELLDELSRRYFEGAQDISESSVLQDAANAVGLRFQGGVSAASALADPGLRARVWHKYQELSATVSEVPLFLVRERVSGNGVELTGTRPMEAWEEALAAVFEKGRLMGMSVPGKDGRDVWLAEANPTSPISMCFNAQHGFVPQGWQYGPEDFRRFDESEDDLMYTAPRIGVKHLDDVSLQSLTEVYRSVLASFPESSPLSILDMCSSWTSHFPAEQLHRRARSELRVVVHGLNAQELEANSVATERHVQDLNKEPRLPWGDESFDFVSNALSVQYLTRPREVFAEMHRVLKPGGVAIVAFSHRSFIEKCVNIWAKEPYDGEGHALILRNYFLGSVPSGSWASLSSVDVSPRHGDPMWVVLAVKS